VNGACPFASVLWLGTDSFLACLGIGLATTTWRQRVGLAAAFGVCDALAVVAGQGLVVDLPTQATVTLYLLCAFLLGLGGRFDRRLLYIIPLLLSVDNMLESRSLGLISPGIAPLALIALVALSSSLLATAGLGLARSCRHLATGTIARISVRRNHERRGHHAVL
jgi:hypothetical protein